MQFDVDRFLCDRPLAITPAGLEEMRVHIAARMATFGVTPPRDLMAAAVEMRAAQAEQGRARRARGVGLIRIRGTISQHAQGDLSSLLMGGTAVEAVSAQLAEFMADDDIGKIVLDVDSPGGSIGGIRGLFNEILEARKTKPIVALANSQMASAAWWFASAASKVYAAPNAQVGSIGVYTLHQDWSKALETEGVKTTLISAGKYKTEGNPFEPLSDETLAYVQGQVDESYADFIHDVARGRGVTDAQVEKQYGQGRMLTARQARANGMIDGVYTLDQVIRRQETVETTVTSEPAQAAATMPAVEAGPIEEALTGEEPEEAEDVGDASEEEKGQEEQQGRARLGQLRLQRLHDRAAAAALEV